MTAESMQTREGCPDELEEVVADVPVTAEGNFFGGVMLWDPKDQRPSSASAAWR